MRRTFSLCRCLLCALVVGLLPAVAQCADIRTIDPIYVQYSGGRLLAQARVHTLFWGSWWDAQGSELRDYLTHFFQDLFADGHYMANLQQYSTSNWNIGNGTLDQTTTVMSDPSGSRSGSQILVTDAQIQQELADQIGSRNLPTPDVNTLYFVFLPPDVWVSDTGLVDALGYHEVFARHVSPPDNYNVVYAVVKHRDDPFPEVEPNNPHLITSTASHELAEAVTDARLDGWSDASGQEIGDIPKYLYEYGWITPHGLWDVLPGSGGRQYLVQKVWSMVDNRPVAFQ